MAGTYSLKRFLKKKFWYRNALIEFVQTLPRLRQLWQVHTPLRDFLKKTSGTEEHQDK